MNEHGQQPIFFDETRRRWSVFSAFIIGLGIIVAVGSVVFGVTIARNPQLPELTVARTLGLAPETPKTSIAQATPKPPADTDARARAHYVIAHNKPVQDAKRRLREAIRREQLAQPIPAAAIAPGHVAGPVRAVFYVNYEKPSLDSLTQHIGETTHLLPTWLRLGADSGSLIKDRQLTADLPAAQTQTAHNDTNDDIAQSEARAHGVAILPVVQNYNSGTDDFDYDRLHTLLTDPAKRARVVGALQNFVVQGGYQGINIDFETDRDEDRAGMTAFMGELAARFHPRGLLVTQDIQLDSTAYDLPTLARVDDFLVPMLYDQHADGTTAGPIAGQDWYAQELKAFMAHVPGNRVVLGLGNYGYDWTAQSTSVQEVSFEDAARIAQESHESPTSEDGVIKIDRASLNPCFTYWDDSQGQDDQIPHKVWLLDATSALNEMRAALPYHTLGAALWRLGTEDPSLWTFFGKDAPPVQSFAPSALSQVTFQTFGTQFEGYGDVLDVVRTPTPGVRRITADRKTGQIIGESFLSYPSQYVIRRTGLVDQTEGDLAGKNTRKIIALTFDDGPDPRWTPQILDILQREHIPATFFVVGENAEAHPGLLAREWNDGMEIGNHSFTHPEMDRISPLRTKLELDATQRVIEAMTGHMTTLFRAPNRADSEPTTEEDFDPIWQAHNLGYLFIGEQNDPTDWQPGITSDQIVRSVVGYVNDPKRNDGNCILLHDAGGDTRIETVKALPRIIETLKAEGFTFVPVSALVGKPKSVLFPEVTGRQRWAVGFDRLFFDVTYWLGNGFTAIFLVTIALGIGRILFMGLLALRQAQTERARVFDPHFAPPVSVVIAAFNEAKVINKTIATLLASDYRDLDIVVVDDGSRDDTAEVVRAAYGDNPRVLVLTKANGGKASALNLGIKECRGEIIVALDADTLFAPDTVSKLVRHFADPVIGAVSGNVKVGNRHNPLTKWQAIEYISSQNFDRRAFDLLNCITVVPGAVGAWRKDAVILAGLYSSQTLAEDTDLTFKVRKLGYRIVTDNGALAFTEAPDTLRDLAKQRFRWAFGTLQCLWKHRGVMLNPRYRAFGLVAMPSLWVYQIGFQAVAPVVDLAIFWSLLYARFFPTGDGRNLVTLLAYWGVFSAVEMAGAALAFQLDRERKGLLVWLPLQRFVYRQLMYYVIVKSLVVAVRGSLVGWGKFERKGTVKVAAGRAEREGARP